MLVSLSTLTSVCLVLTSSTSALLAPKPFTQQANDQFNALRYMGASGAFHENSGVGISKDTPPQCTIDQAHMFMRHGERFPSASSGETFEAFFKRLQAATTEQYNNPFGFLHDAEYFVTNSSDYEHETYYNAYAGLADCFSFGSDLRQRYNHLVDTNRTTPIFSAGQKRVVDSATAFSQGFFGNGYSGDYQLVVLPEDESQGANSLTNTVACTNFDGDDNYEKVLKGENYQYAQYEADRLNQLAPGYNLTASDIFTMVDYCAFETNVKGFSKFCDVLSPDAFVATGYHIDLRNWYSQGPGYNMSYVSGFTLANATATLLQQDNEDSLYLSFTHDDDIVRYLTGLGIFDDEPDLDKHEINFKRAFKIGEIVPLGGRLLTERLSCTNATSGETDTFVRLLLNDQVFPVPNCADGPGFSCPLDDYLELAKTHTVDYKEACGIQDDVPNYVSFFWDWTEDKYPTVADAE
ncbi:unnamed protein product [Ambrosiozyma monospora]|uniref:Unnamed protein product n=1 Tax=Ambrosiozyma monospora TaxID=43982 RepID=A0A9W6YXV0_AMBMO|nr:unnamed protein product [Ambrosiozyma monospora]